MVKRNKNNNIILKAENEDFSMVTEIQTDMNEKSEIDITKEIPIIPLRNMVMFPQVVMPITVGRVSSQKLVSTAYKKEELVAVVCQRQGETEEPDFQDLYHEGVVVKILRVFDIPGGSMTVFLQSAGPKIRLDSITRTTPFLVGKISILEEKKVDEKNDEFKVLMETCKELSNKFIEVSDKLSPDTSLAVRNIDSPDILISFICTNFPFPVTEKIRLLKYDNIRDRAYDLIDRKSVV